MPPVLCERCRTFGRHLGKRCINCGFKLVLLAGAVLVGHAGYWPGSYGLGGGLGLVLLIVVVLLLMGRL